MLHTRPTGLHATREPLQIGAEIYGHAGLEADAEIQDLALASLALAGFDASRASTCRHVGVLRADHRRGRRAKRRRAALYTLLRAKDVPGLSSADRRLRRRSRATRCWRCRAVRRRRRAGRARETCCRHARHRQGAGRTGRAGRAARWRRAAVDFDLADLRGYPYDSGAMFALYVPGLPNALARGGRYDEVGEAFGRTRPAAGFSLDLRELARLLPSGRAQAAIRAPWGNAPGAARARSPRCARRAKS